jgi:hypothetical protein
VERRVAVATEFDSGGPGTQPMATGLAFRIKALYSPSRQVLHFSPLWNDAKTILIRPLSRKTSEHCRDSATSVLWCQAERYNI